MVGEAERHEALLREDKAWDFLIQHQPQDAVRVIKGESRAEEEVNYKDEIDFMMEDHFFHLEMEPPPPEMFGFNPYDDDLPLDAMPPVMRMGYRDQDDDDFDPQPHLLRDQPYA